MPTQLYDKDKIIDACLRVFAQHGYPNSSTALLAEAAGVSKALLFHHFKHKKALYLAVVAQCIANGRAAIGLAPLEAATKIDFFTVREQVSLAKLKFNRQNPDGYCVLKEAFFATPQEVKVEIDALYGTFMAERQELWQRLFANVPLRAGVDRAQAFELIMLTLDYFDRKFLAEMTPATELDEEYAKQFLAQRNAFLAMIRYGIEQVEEASS